MMRRRTVLVLVALLGFAVIGCDDEIASTTVGVTVTRPVPSAVETLQDVRANTSLRQRPASRERVIPFRRIRRGVDPSVFTPRVYQGLAPAVSSIFAPVSMAPALDIGFVGLLNPTPDVIPPDTMGAAGPNHLVSILNSDFGVFDKTGSILEQVTLENFWASLGNNYGEPANFPFDPKILFDQHSGRFIASSAGGGTSTASWILIAVSSTSDPLDNWVKVAIDTTNEIDYPALGVDDANIYISANMYSGNTYLHSKVWVIPKDQLLSGPPGTPVWTEFTDPSGSNSSMQPAHTFGTPGAQYFVYEWSDGLLRLAKVYFGRKELTWATIGYLSVDAFTSTDYLPRIQQLGDIRTIDPGGTRLLNAVYRNGSLWTTHHVEVPGGGRTEVAWYGIDPVSVGVTMQGRINDPSRWYVYPSIAVNQDNDVAVGFSGSSATEYIGAYYTLRRSGDPSGTMQPVSLLKSGESSYYKTINNSDNRWGDYSATCVDPADNVSFWTLQEYAETPSGGRSMWGTWWGRFRAASINAPTGLTAAPFSSSRIDLGWTDQSTDETGFKIERKTGAGGTYAQIGTVGANVTTYSDTLLAEGTTYYYRVRSYNAGGNSAYSNEASATTPVTPPAAPDSLTATPFSSSRIDLGWTDLSTNETGFKVERKTGAGAYAQIGTVGANVATYRDSGVAASSTYTYRVRAYNAADNSAYSNEASATTPAPPSGGGGGGGCAFIDRKTTEEDPSAFGSVLFLLSPLGVIAWLRRPSVPPRGRPGDP